MLFELNCGYHTQVPYKEDVDSCFKSKAADEFSEELRNLMAEYRENLQQAQKLQKQAHDKRTKLRSYALSKEIWLNS